MDSHDYWLIREVRAVWKEGIAEKRQAHQKVKAFQAEQRPKPARGRRR